MAVSKKRLTAWLPLLLSSAATLILVQLGLVSSLTPFAQAWLFQMRRVQPWSEDIVLIKIDQNSLDHLGWFPWERHRYAQLLRKLAAAEVETVAFNIVFSEETDQDDDFAQAMADHGQVLLASAWHRDQAPWLPNPTLANAAAAIGHITQVERTRPASVRPYIQKHPALAIATAQLHQLSQGELQFLFTRQPLFADWPGPVAQIQQYSFVDVLEQRVPAAALRGKVALVGMTAEGFDPFISPLEPDQTASGIHLHAAVLHSSLQQSFLRRPNSVWGWVGLLVWAISLRYGLPRLSERRQLGAVLGTALLWPGLGVLALHANILLPIALPMTLLATTAVAVLLLQNIQLQGLNSQLQSKATTDVVTSLKNRAFFNDYSAYLWQSCLREQQSLCAILCDVDHFKQYNDTYGHLNGDRCLYAVSQSLKNSVYRPADIVARYGGEEFVILLPDSNLDHGCAIARRIQDDLLHQAIPHASSSTSSRVTLSFGIACITPSNGDRLALLLDQADQALYQAKQEGRDRYKTRQL